ncbi:sulfite exporter TauE/SafE family protein, partial [Campylobacter coli]|nr:sulfite exporter TauE/SafE family protein [Campylobacter coli]EAI0758252.1 sulfite exporter TauE/SafE family protein [Campylobacter coli]EAI8483614.1 sulfite exporter TauE/SafE family protein [Campylobacter coli]EHO7242702.1 sulfite exporter TauE/SafE family protein [Campylobacter coli]
MNFLPLNFDFLAIFSVAFLSSFGH